MSRETPDEPVGAEQHWRRLLREPDALPGQGLADKDAAWDTLFERLNAKPRRRFAGFGVAVACLLIALMPVSRLFHDGPENGRPRPDRPGSHLTAGGKGLPAAEKIRPAAPPRTAPAPSTAVKPITPAPVAAATARRAPKKPQLPKISPVSNQTVPAGPIPAAIAAPAPPAIILAESTPPPAHPSKPAAKKQWKIVDINELEPRNTRPQMVADRQPGLVRLGLGPGNSFIPEDPPARGEDTRLKINLRTQNH